MSTTYTISSDTKTVTLSLANAIPGTPATDDYAMVAVLEPAQGTVKVRYIAPDVVGVIRAFMASQVDPSNNPLYPNIEAMLFASTEKLFVDNVGTHYPASVQTALSNVATAQTALQTAIGTVIAELVLL